MTIDEAIKLLKSYRNKCYDEDDPDRSSNPSIYIEIGYTKFDLEKTKIYQDGYGNLVIDFSDLSWDDISI